MFTLQAIFPFCLPNTEAVPREKEKKKMSAESATAIPRGQVSIFFFGFQENSCDLLESGNWVC